MSKLLFPACYLNEQNKELLRAIAEEFHYCEEDDEITIDFALSDLDYSYLFDNKVIEISTDDYYSFDEVTTELFNQKIAYDLIHNADYDGNSEAEFYRPHMQSVQFIGIDDNDCPTIKIETIRNILDSQDESLSDSEILGLLIDKINLLDFCIEGNRIQDFA